MKISLSYPFLLFVLLQAGTVFAGPPQRLIIQFDTALSAEQRQVLQQQIQSLLKTEMTILPHSTEQRWIIVISPPLAAFDLEKANAAIARLEHVKYVEPDQVLNVLH
jgi:hypothetical protein